MQKCTLPSEKPFRQVILDFFNLILYNNSLSSHYWNKQLKKLLIQKFSSILSDDEMDENYDLYSNISIFDLFDRLQCLTSIRISVHALHELELNPGGFEFVDPDIELHSRIVHLNLIDYADGMALYYEAENRNDNPNTQVRLLSLARTRLESSLSQSGIINFSTNLQLGNISRSLAKKASVSEIN